MEQHLHHDYGMEQTTINDVIVALLFMFIVLLLMGALSGCGKSSSSTASPPTQSQSLCSQNVICKQACLNTFNCGSICLNASGSSCQAMISACESNLNQCLESSETEMSKHIEW